MAYRIEITGGFHQGGENCRIYDGNALKRRIVIQGPESGQWELSVKDGDGKILGIPTQHRITASDLTIATYDGNTVHLPKPMKDEIDRVLKELKGEK